MKKKSIMCLIAVGILSTMLAGCGESKVPDRISTSLPDVIITEEEEKAEADAKDQSTETIDKDVETDEAKYGEDAENIDGENAEGEDGEATDGESEDGEVADGEKSDKEDSKSDKKEDSKSDKEDSKNDGEESEEEKPVDTRKVSGYHNVTAVKGITYNALIDEVIKGTKAVPGTYPDINSVNLNAAGTYTVNWYYTDKDGNLQIVPYAAITVTLVEPEPEPTAVPQ